MGCYILDNGDSYSRLAINVKKVVRLYFHDILMSIHASVLVDSVGPPSAEVCRAAASFP
jgi:hypothetical protein